MKDSFRRIAYAFTLAFASLTLVTSNPEVARALEVSEDPMTSDEISSIPETDGGEFVANTTAPESVVESSIQPTTEHSKTHAPQANSLVELPEAEDVSLTTATSVVITEIQTRGPGGATDERIVLYNASHLAVDLTNWCIQYGSATGTTYSKVFCIESTDKAPSARAVLPARSWLAAGVTNTQTLMHDILFSSSMAENGKLRLVDDKGVVVDLVGWGTANESLGSPAPATTSTLSLQRRITESGAYQDMRDNSQDFIRGAFTTQYQTGALYEVSDLCVNVVGIQESVPAGVVVNSRGECVDRASINFCEGVTISEIGANTTRQYIELHNSSNTSKILDGCRILTNRSTSQYYQLSGGLAAQAYKVVYVDQTPLKLTKTTNGTVYIIASDEETEVDSRFYEDLSSETSWSEFRDGWKQTYLLTPGSENHYAQYPPCDEGQIRNPESGRCRMKAATRTLTPCREGQYRSEETNRCRSFALASSTRKPCSDDQFRNPLTGRCKKIASADDLKDCGEGRERNPLTNRCRNVIRSDVPAAAFAVEPIKESAMAFSGWWAFGGVLALALAYAGWEWRYEIRSGVQSIAARMVKLK